MGIIGTGVGVWSHMLISALEPLDDTVTAADVFVSTSIEHDGVTFHFDRPVPTIRTCLGEPCVISSEAFSVTSISPASSDLVGSSGAFTAHGAMLDPGDVAASDAQGFDGLIGRNDAPGQSVSATAYSAARNVDPAVSGPLSFAQGATGSVVKSVRVDGMTDTGPWQTIGRYVVLSVLDEVPTAGFFRPGMAPGAKTIYGREADVRFDVLRNLSPLSGSIGRADAEARIVPTSPTFGLENAEKLRRLDVEENGPAESNYSRNFAFTRADAHHFLHEDHSNTDKRLTFLRSIQHGIDLAAAQANGYSGSGGAGQHYGRSFFSFVAAFALGSAPLLAAARALGGGALRQHYWAVSDELEGVVGFPGPAGDLHRNASPLLRSDQGVPEWDREPGSPDWRDASQLARYREMWPAGMMEALNVALLQNGPGGISGVQAILDGGVFDQSNPNAAALAYYDRMVHRPVGMVSPDFLTPNRSERWNVRRPLLELPRWTGRPDWYEGDGQVATGDGEIIYDWSAHTFATEQVTRRDVRYSLDGVQWLEVHDVPASGTLAGLLRGAPHHVAFRLVSASGAGRWSPTYPLTGPSGAAPEARNVAIPTGSEANAAPVNTVLPRTMVRELEHWPGSDTLDAGSNVTAEQLEGGVVLRAGVGYWSGYPAPTFTYELREGTTVLEALTNGELDLQGRFDLSERTINIAVTATNGTGSVTVATQDVTLPEIVPATLYSADFTIGDDSAGWAAGPGACEVSYDTANGRLVVVPTGSWTGAISPPMPVDIGFNYTVDVLIENTFGSVDMTLGTTPGDDDLATNSARISAGATGTLSLSFTAATTEVYATIRRRGAGGDQDIYIHSLAVMGSQ